MLEPEIEARPWEEQLALDAASYREQLAYLFERSAFYREKLSAAGFASAEGAGELDEIAQLPLTEKRELKETASRENPIGTHLCAKRSFASTRRAARPARRATSRSPRATSTTG
jgi:phenylacetate-CoA ligase